MCIRDSINAEYGIAKRRMARPRRVLFVGDSLTYVNDLDEHVRRIAQVAGFTDGLHIERCVRGGAPLKSLWKSTDAQRRIGSGKWDVVVVQEDLPETDVANFKFFGQKFHSAIREAGAQTVLLSCWEYERLGWIDTEGIAEAHDVLAEELGSEVRVAHAGRAWKLAQSEMPELELYHEDREHPSPAGTVLAAAVVFSTIWSQTAEELAYVQPCDQPRDPMEPELIQKLHQIAWETAQPHISPKRSTAIFQKSLVIILVSVFVTAFAMFYS
eukprot:TRINITY_DN11607_c0_g1_i1.p2 TRINITY_DN11607_c0_g1~~TRINITY_DN11607_c0_g1_i1.p2  ORF type:complete len:270 (+),score=56.89 TRINITY_DN11607_c0_g1_i1:99-908(+)